MSGFRFHKKAWSEKNTEKKQDNTNDSHNVHALSSSPLSSQKPPQEREASPGVTKEESGKGKAQSSSNIHENKEDTDSIIIQLSINDLFSNKINELPFFIKPTFEKAINDILGNSKKAALLKHSQSRKQMVSIPILLEDVVSNLKDVYSQDILFDPVIPKKCGHPLEKDWVERGFKEHHPLLETPYMRSHPSFNCPICRTPILKSDIRSSFIFNTILDKVFEKRPSLQKNRYFKLKFLANALRHESHNSQLEKICKIFEASAEKLNDIEDEGQYKGLSAIYLLANSHKGRRMIYEHAHLCSNITTNSLNSPVNEGVEKGATVLYWLAHSRRGPKYLLEDATLRSKITAQGLNAFYKGSSAAYHLLKNVHGQQLLNENPHLLAMIDRKLFDTIKNDAAWFNSIKFVELRNKITTLTLKNALIEIFASRSSQQDAKTASNQGEKKSSSNKQRS